MNPTFSHTGRVLLTADAADGASNLACLATLGITVRAFAADIISVRVTLTLDGEVSSADAKLGKAVLVEPFITLHTTSGRLVDGLTHKILGDRSAMVRQLREQLEKHPALDGLREFLAGLPNASGVRPSSVVLLSYSIPVDNTEVPFLQGSLEYTVLSRSNGFQATISAVRPDGQAQTLCEPIPLPRSEPAFLDNTAASRRLGVHLAKGHRDTTPEYQAAVARILDRIYDEALATIAPPEPVYGPDDTQPFRPVALAAGA